MTVCENGYGKRTPFGPGIVDETEEAAIETGGAQESELPRRPRKNRPSRRSPKPPRKTNFRKARRATTRPPATRGNQRYRRQRRGGKGLRDIRTTERNGKVIDVIAVADDDEVIMITARGKIQRVHASDISQIGRNTQGVRIIRLDEEDTLVSLARIPADVTKSDTSVP